jgi:ubiquinone/menaquinone biosynthesis C-methylase UbiE
MRAYRPKGLWQAEKGELYTHTNPLVRWSFWKRLDVALSRAKVSKNMVVLDVGCGQGFFLPSLALTAKQVYAVDTDTWRIKRAREFIVKEGEESKNQNVALLNASAFALPIKDRSIDVVFMLDLLEHLPRPLNEFSLIEAKRVLKPTGFLICSLPIEKGGALLLRTIARKLSKVPQPRNYSAKELVSAFIFNEAIGEHHDHAGYDYLRDLHLIQKFFRNVQRAFIPFPVPCNLNLTVVIKAQKG